MKLLATVALVAIAFAGCTSSSSIEYEVPPMDDEGNYIIEMTDSFKFVPENAEVPVGATVIWKNTGSATHNVHASDDAWQHTNPTGDDFTVVITEAMIGEREYVCDPHVSLGMVGNLKVVPAS